MVQEQFRAILHVNSAEGDDRASGEPDQPLRTLTCALQQATAGSIIRLSPGEYSAATGEVFPLTVFSGVTVIGDIPNRGRGVVIAGSGEFQSSIFGLQAATLLLESAQLRGVTVSHTTSNGTGVWIESNSPAIASCTLRQCGREGIFVAGTAKPAIANCLFQANVGSGIAFVRFAKGEIRRSVFLDNGAGIILGDQAAPLIVDSQFAENRSGLVMLGAARPVLRRNAFEYNRVGLAISGKAQPDLGNSQDGADNLFRHNVNCDLRNQTAIALPTAGNHLSPAKVSGPVQFITLQSPTPAASAEWVPPLALNPDWATGFIQHLPAAIAANVQPTAQISRADYAAMLARAFAIVLETAREATLTRLEAIVTLAKGLNLPEAAPGWLAVYRDRAQIPSQAAAAVAAATQHRLVVLYPQTDRLKPLQPITQAEAIAMIYQGLVARGAKAIASPYIVQPALGQIAFADTPSHWAKAFLQGAVSQNWLAGSSEGTFVPHAPIAVAIVSDVQDTQDIQASANARAVSRAIAEEIIALLQFQGIEVRVGQPTLSADDQISLQIGIQTDTAADPDLNGVAIAHPLDLESARCAHVLHKTILRNLDTRSRGVQPGETLPAATYPSVTVNVGFITGREDQVNLDSPDYRRAMAQAIATGALHYLQACL